MKVYINPGHDLDYDSGAVNPTSGLRECDVAAKIGARVKEYLEAAGCECRLLQSDNLYYDSQYDDRPIPVCDDANRECKIVCVNRILHKSKLSPIIG